ncbi:MAG TPA: amino acid permease [Acidobacteriota bacterium]|nr:amino acid permease [Acidobacteriota bacterium]
MDEQRHPAENEDGLIRGLGLKEATSANIVEMLGIGPFITIPFLLAAMGGPHAMLGWAAGAVLAICDGLVWAELGAAMPGAGGSYIYLREAYNPKKMGQMMSFLFVWMIFFTAPLSVATGAVGFAEYSRFFFPGMSELGTKLVAVALCAGVTFALYRGIRTIGKVSFLLMIVVVGSILWVIVSGWPVMRTELLLDIPADAFSFSWGFFQGLGGAALIAIYGYGGYNNVCFLGGEVKEPSRNIPLAVIGSILIVATLYVLLNISLIGVVPWREAIETKHIVSDYMQIIYGDWAAQVITVLILGASFASIFALLLGYSRIPYAAAKDGRFFSVFAKLHPVKRFPHVSLLVLGGFSVFWCFLELSEIIESLMSIQTLILFLSQILAVTLVRRNRPDIKRPFKMWLYPIPSIVAAALWLLVMLSTGVETVLLALVVLAGGIGIYMVWARIAGAWPFQQE